MKKQLLFASAVVLSLFTQAVKAQHATTTMDSIVVQENRIKEPYGKQNRNIQILDSRQIKTLPVKSTNELLAYVAGVDIRQRGPWGTQSDVSIDGSTFDQVLILINGVKMSDPQTGHHVLNIPIPIGMIDHIEVVRGPAARTYGVNALAGAINIVTKTPKENNVFAQAYSGSSFKNDTAVGDTYFNTGAQIAASFAGKKQAHTVSAAYDKGNGYRYNTGFEGTRLFYQNDITLNKKNTIQAMGGYINNSFGANAFYAAPVDVESTEKVETAIGSIKYTYQPSSKITISPRVSYRYNKDDYIFVRQKPSVYHNIHETNVVTAELQSTIKLKKGTIGLGVEYRNEDINSTNLGKRDRNNLGIYAEYKRYFTEKLNGSIGVYANKNSDYDWEFFPGIDLGYTVTKNIRLFANATMGQRLPTYTDLYYKGPTNIGNAQLESEYAQYVEIGGQYKNQLLFARAAFFYKRNTDFIDWVRANSVDPWQPQNFQSVLTNGYTLSANYNLGKAVGLSSDHKMNVTANYTYLNPEIDAPATAMSRYAINALRHQATASIRTLWFDKIQANIAGRYMYRINGNDYTLIDLRLGYQLKSFLIFTDINNILDTQYKEAGAVPLPGSWFTLGVRLNTSWK
ncbi:MAG: TonB-dependent receptor [Flavipsychrobacter sp.]